MSLDSAASDEVVADAFAWLRFVSVCADERVARVEVLRGDTGYTIKVFTPAAVFTAAGGPSVAHCLVAIERNLQSMSAPEGANDGGVA